MHLQHGNVEVAAERCSCRVAAAAVGCSCRVVAVVVGCFCRVVVGAVHLVRLCLAVVVARLCWMKMCLVLELKTCLVSGR